MANIEGVGAGLQRAVDSAAEGAWKLRETLTDQQRVRTKLDAFLRGLSELLPLLDQAHEHNTAYQEHLTSGVTSVGQASEELRQVGGHNPSSPLARAIEHFSDVQGKPDSLLESGWQTSTAQDTNLEEAYAAVEALRTAIHSARGPGESTGILTVTGISHVQEGIKQTEQYAARIGVPVQVPRLP